MVVLVGERIKLGGLTEVIKLRQSAEYIILPESPDIKRQENDILAIQDVSFVIYDMDQYYNDSRELIDIIKRIARTNKAKPVLVVPTDNPKNEIVKCAVDSQIKYFINSAKSLGEQKDELEKILNGFYEANAREDILAAEEEVQKDHKRLNEFVEELYDAKQREDEKENTIIIKKKRNLEIIVDTLGAILRILFSIVIILMVAIAVMTLMYESSRQAFFEVLNGTWQDILLLI